MGKHRTLSSQYYYQDLKEILNKIDFVDKIIFGRWQSSS